MFHFHIIHGTYNILYIYEYKYIIYILKKYYNNNKINLNKIIIK